MYKGKVQLEVYRVRLTESINSNCNKRFNGQEEQKVCIEKKSNINYRGAGVTQTIKIETLNTYRVF